MNSIKEKICNLLKIVGYKEFNNNVNNYNKLVENYNILVNKYNNLSKENNNFETLIYKENPNLYSEDFMEKSSRFFIRQRR